MDGAEGRAHAGVLLDESDAPIEIVAAEKDVVEQCRHVLRWPRDGGCDGCACGNRKESSTRNGFHMRPNPRTADYTFEPGLWRALALAISGALFGRGLTGQDVGSAA